MAQSDSSKRAGKRRHGDVDDDDDDDDGGLVKARKLTKQEEMQLKLLANLPSMNAPLRDARGRRRSTCVSSTEMVEAGLAALVGSSAAISTSAEVLKKTDEPESASSPSITSASESLPVKAAAIDDVTQQSSHAIGTDGRSDSDST